MFILKSCAPNEPSLSMPEPSSTYVLCGKLRHIYRSGAGMQYGRNFTEAINHCPAWPHMSRHHQTQTKVGVLLSPSLSIRSTTFLPMNICAMYGGPVQSPRTVPKSMPSVEPSFTTSRQAPGLGKLLLFTAGHCRARLMLLPSLHRSLRTAFSLHRKRSKSRSEKSSSQCLKGIFTLRRPVPPQSVRGEVGRCRPSPRYR